MIATLLVHANNIRCHDKRATSKKRLLQHLSQLLAHNSYHISSHDILQALIARERLGSTDLGRGIAVPHARINDLNHTIAAMITLAAPIDYNTADKQPVDIVYGLLVPAQDNEHLGHLAALVSAFRQDNICQAIRAATDAHALFELLLSIERHEQTKLPA